MEPNTTYRPPLYLGDVFVNGRAKKYEIVETHWGIPEVEKERLVCTLELRNGHKIHHYAAPQHAVLKAVGVRPADKPDARVIKKTVAELVTAKAGRLIKFI